MASMKRLTRQQREDLGTGIVLIAPAAIIMGVITLYPLIRSFWISLHTWDLHETRAWPPVCRL